MEFLIFLLTHLPSFFLQHTALGGSQGDGLVRIKPRHPRETSYLRGDRHKVTRESENL